MPLGVATEPEPKTSVLRRKRHPKLDIEGECPAGGALPDTAVREELAPAETAAASDDAESSSAEPTIWDAPFDEGEVKFPAGAAPATAVPSFLIDTAAKAGADVDAYREAKKAASPAKAKPGRGSRKRVAAAPDSPSRPGDASDDFTLPPLSLLSSNPNSASSASTDAELERTARRLQSTLEEFGLTSRVSGWTAGPLVTTFKIEMGEGERVNKITNLQDDIQLSLASESVRIFAPIPGTSLVGIEIPNKQASERLPGRRSPVCAGRSSRVCDRKGLRGCASRRRPCAHAAHARRWYHGLW